MTPARTLTRREPQKLAGSEGDEGEHIERYLAECYVETDACFVPASGLRSLPASHKVPGPGYGPGARAGRSPELTGATGS